MIQSPAKILVVDDERINLQLLSQGLKDLYTILFAQTGEDAVAVAISEMPDLILLDIELGDMDGYEVLKRLKNEASTKQIPVIFVTAKDTIDDELKGLELGAIDYFRKPYLMPLVRVRVRHQIELKQKTELLERLSAIDPLTGLYNRRKFEQHFESTMNYAKRSGRGVSVVVVDIDHFKQYNDIYGHVAGDDALKLVAKLITNGAARPMDFVARYGGEEFVIVIADSPPEQGALVAEKIRQSVEDKAIAHKGSNYGYITISAGVAHFDGRHNLFPEISDFIRHADTCLYEAKEAGRNCVVCEHFKLDVNYPDED